MSLNCSILQKTAGFRRFLLFGGSCGTRVRPVGVLDEFCFPSLLGSMPDPAAVPRSLSPALDLPRFFLEVPLAPVDRTSTAALKGSVKRLRADSLRPR